MTAVRVGILALQGCVEPHIRTLAKLNVESVKVRSEKELAEVDRLILPGGESSTMIRLLHTSDLLQPVREFGRAKPVWGVCAGAILLANEVKHPEQISLGLINVCAYRNYYGSQRESFSAKISGRFELEVDFIRAPLLTPTAESVEVLATLEKQPVLLREGHVLVSSFHSELREATEIHRYFLEIDG